MRELRAPPAEFGGETDLAISSLLLVRLLNAGVLELDCEPTWASSPCARPFASCGQLDQAVPASPRQPAMWRFRLPVGARFAAGVRPGR